MTEQQLYEKIGRLQMELDALNNEHDLVLKVFSEVVSGECDRRRVMIDLTNRRVHWAAPGQRPGLPPTINGLPKCVVAPADSVPDAIAERAKCTVNGDGFGDGS